MLAAGGAAIECKVALIGSCQLGSHLANHGPASEMDQKQHAHIRAVCADTLVPLVWPAAGSPI